MRTDKLVIFLASSFLWLAGCSTMPAQHQQPTNKPLDWDNRLESLSALQNWDLRGLVAIRTKTQAQSANVRWQQNGKNYEILFSGPLGTNTFVLNGTANQVELQNSQGKSFYANSPEALLTAQTGLDLPASSMVYWIRGIPVPNVPAEKHFDAFHHLIELHQQGWNIQYLRYTSVNNVDLPSKMIMDYPHLNIKFIVSEWHLDQAPA